MKAGATIRLDYLASAVALAETAELEPGLSLRQRRALHSLSVRYFYEATGLRAEAREGFPLSTGKGR